MADGVHPHDGWDAATVAHPHPDGLHGAEGTVVELDDRTATVELDHPVGRFSSGEIRCPPLALERLGRA